jgi:hypothetical protein
MGLDTVQSLAPGNVALPAGRVHAVGLERPV